MDNEYDLLRDEYLERISHHISNAREGELYLKDDDDVIEFEDMNLGKHAVVVTEDKTKPKKIKRLRG